MQTGFRAYRKAERHKRTHQTGQPRRVRISRKRLTAQKNRTRAMRAQGLLS